ncbi:MAG TPA: hypothetical protein DEO70_12145 [Bacteroidales bacterium]|nr:MAG: hypothetical protein A2X11_10135 [Bacteroidetes bacterium GWE2_42_24]OFY25869.1 MAG: hypothetical protein A2X09_09510 [Bacteroidetes bacterium GWF2_43_11]HBZ67579.1 hypothetical protein [Bacteroidales bacterium]
MEHSVVIRLKPYLKEFITHRFGSELSSRKNVVGILLQQFITYTPSGSCQREATGPDCMVIPLVSGPAYNPRRGNVWISPRHQKELERVIYQLFRSTFFTYMDDRSRYIDMMQEGTIKDCILQFCIDFGLSPDNVQYDTLKKAWYRHRKHKEHILQSKKKAEKNGLNLSLFRPLIFIQTQYEPLYSI